MNESDETAATNPVGIIIQGFFNPFQFKHSFITTKKNRLGINITRFFISGWMPGHAAHSESNNPFIMIRRCRINHSTLHITYLSSNIYRNINYRIAITINWSIIPQIKKCFNGSPYNINKYISLSMHVWGRRRDPLCDVCMPRAVQFSYFSVLYEFPRTA